MFCYCKDIAKLHTVNYIMMSVICLSALGLLLLGCDQPIAPVEVLVNPLDPLSKIFIPPITTIESGATESQTISASSVTFRWYGNEYVSQYSYSTILGDTLAWSQWSSETTITLNYLDEGLQYFSVRSKHRNGITIEENPPQINYTVDAVKGPSLMFCPRCKYTSHGQTFTYDIKAEEVSFMYGAKISIQYDPSRVDVTGILEGALINSNGGKSILLRTIDAATHIITIEIATVGRVPKGVSGSGVVAILQCKAIVAGTALFQFNNSETLLRDTLNVPITPRTLVQGRVEIE